MKAAFSRGAWLARVCVGLVLVYSGMLKAARPHEFLNSVLQYQILGPKASVLVAAALPFLELTIGAALLIGVCALGAGSLAAALFLVFSVGQGSALLRGIDADCGCFGAGEPVTGLSLLRTLGLFAAAVGVDVRELLAPSTR